MRDFASCFGEHAVRVSDSACSGSRTKSSVIAPSVATSTSSSSSSSVQAAITTLYRARLSTHKDLLIKVTWSMTHVGPTLSLGLVDDTPSSSSNSWNPDAVASQLLRRKQGTRSYGCGSSIVALYWDYSAAKFLSSSPEPASNFYVVVLVDAEFALLLGDLCRDFIAKFQDTVNVAEFWLAGRREQVLSQVIYSTRARFSDGGRDHDIAISCRGDGCDDSDESELLVYVDRKRVVQVRNLQWNFRGNQTIFIDGSPVDMLWDVKDWWFSAPRGYAAFMLRKRSALESRLWCEEEVLHWERGISGFSLLIQAFKNP